jgi:hypothetical protein
MASALYGPCIERRSCWRSNNWLSHRTACVIAFVNGLDKFKSKSLTSSHKPHQNVLLRTLSSQSTSHASCWKSATWTEAGRDPCYKERNFVVAVQTLSVSPNVLLYSVRKSFKSSRRKEFFSNNGANHDNATSDSKVPMSPTWDASVGYCRGCNRNINQIWLTKPQNLDRVPSNFSNRLTLGSLVGSGTGLGSAKKIHYHYLLI